jgi:hypothetical protein
VAVTPPVREARRSGAETSGKRSLETTAPACSARQTSSCITFGSSRVVPVGPGSVEGRLNLVHLADAEGVLHGTSYRAGER